MEFKTEHERIYVADASGKVIAEVTFPTSNGVATIDHTFVDPCLRGQGVAEKLVKRAVEKIVADGNRIAATCPYAVAWFKRHPEYIADCTAPTVCQIRIPQ